jgi:DNA ligase-associated metallophosphoesterase
VIQRCGERLELRPDGTVLLADRGALLAADLHLGKAATFAASGLSAPAGTLEEDLRRLERAVRETACDSLWVLGDLLHHPDGTGKALIARVAAWREAVEVAVTVVPGNHDRELEAAARRWDLQVAPAEAVVGPFRLRHRATVSAGGVPEGCLEICGHLHPVVRMRGGGDDLRLRCFVEDGNTLTLPAFSTFAGGAEVEPRPGRRLYAVTGNEVIAL